MRTVETIMAALQGIVDAAAGREFTDDEATQYEALEKELASVNRTNQINARNTAYNMPVRNNDINMMITGGSQQEKRTDEDRAFENYLRTGVPNSDLTQAKNAQGTTPDSGGGYTAPPAFRLKMVEVMKSFGGFAPEADSFNTETGQPMEYPSVDDTANSGQITAEGSAVSGGADLVFGTVLLGSFTYTSSGASNAPLKVSRELIQDSAFNVEDLVSRKLAERIARKQASDWVVGAGTTLPFGVIHAGLTADKTVTGAFAAATYGDLIDVESALDPAYQQNAKWLMNSTTWGNLRKIVDTAGRPLLTEQAASGAGGAIERRVLGYPVILDQACPSNTSLNTKFAALGNFREAYVIRRVANLEVLVNPYSSMGSRQIEFSAFERADGNIQNRKAYAVLARGAS